MNRTLFYVLATIALIGMMGFKLWEALPPAPIPEPAPAPEPETDLTDGWWNIIMTLAFAGIVIYLITNVFFSRNHSDLITTVTIAMGTAFIVAFSASLINNINNANNTDTALPPSSEIILRMSDALGYLVNLFPIVALAIVSGIVLFYLMGFVAR